MRTFIFLTVLFFGGVLCQNASQMVTSESTTITRFTESQIKEVNKAGFLDIESIQAPLAQVSLQVKIINPIFQFCISVFIQICQKMLGVIQVSAVVSILTDLVSSFQVLAPRDFSLELVARIKIIIQDACSKLSFIKNSLVVEVISDALSALLVFVKAAAEVSIVVSLIAVVAGFLSFALYICLQFTPVAFITIIVTVCVKLIGLIIQLAVSISVSGGLGSLVAVPINAALEVFNGAISKTLESLPGLNAIDSACVCGLITTVAGLLQTLLETLQTIPAISTGIITFIEGFISDLTALASSAISSLITLLCRFVATLIQALPSACSCANGGKTGILGIP